LADAFKPTKAAILKVRLGLARGHATMRARPAAMIQVPVGRPLSDESSPSREWRSAAFSLVLAVGNVGLVTAVMLLFDRQLASNLVPITYLIPVIFAATQWGVWHAMLASLVAMAAADFFFFTPLYSLRVDDPKEAVD